MSREVIIYGIRAVGTTEIRYVGQTATTLAERKAHGYVGAIGAWLRGVAWEYVILERTTLTLATRAEIRHLDTLREAGAQLLNLRSPVPSTARAPGDNGAPRKRMRRLISATRAEFENWDRQARAAGLSFSAWALQRANEAP